MKHYNTNLKEKKKTNYQVNKVLPTCFLYSHQLGPVTITALTINKTKSKIIEKKI